MITKRKNNQSGFTLVEVIVATAIFVTVVVAMLGLFDYTLKINRRVQAMREVAQGTRIFVETLTREIRNGRIDYEAGSWAGQCDAENYYEGTAAGYHKSLALISRSGDKLCFYFDNGTLTLKKKTTNGDITATVFGSTRFKVIPETFRFFVYPNTDPSDNSAGSYPAVQPYVTVVSQFQLGVNDEANPVRINYQTTISTDIYDIPHL